MVAAPLIPWAVTPPVAPPGTTTPPVASTLPSFDDASVSDWMYCYENPETDSNENLLHLMAEEFAREHYNDAPTKERPRWKVDSSGKDVKVTFGEARERVWTTSKQEVQAYRDRVVKMVGKSFEDIDPVKDITELFLGKARPVMQLMQSSLGLSYEKACHFLGTYCVQKAYRLSAAELYDKSYDRIKTHDLMEESEYRGVWQLIGKSSSGEPGGRNPKYFWQKFQERMNEAFFEINVSLVGHLLVSLDDDKKKASVGKGKNMQGLKQHVLSDLRRGIVGHTAVSPATLLTLGVMWEKKGESSYECYVKLVKELFGEDPKLDKVTFCSDRGYWILDLLKYLLERGADIHGTVRRQPWYYWTYETELKDWDTRYNINKPGPATLYVAESIISGRKVSANGFRNGTGGVATTISTEIVGNHWECVVNKTKRVTDKIPLVVSSDHRRGLTFRPAGSNVDMSDDTIAVLGALPIEHVTEYQGRPEWFIARKLSCTSKSVATHVPIQLRLDKEKEDRQPHWINLQQYLDTSGGIELVLVDEEPNLREDEALNTVEAVEAGGAGDEESTIAEDGLRLEVEGMIRDATDGVERNESYCQVLINEIKEDKHKDKVAEMARQIGAKVLKTYKSNRERVIAWLQCDSQRRPYIFLTVTELKVSALFDLMPRILDTNLQECQCALGQVPRDNQSNSTFKAQQERRAH